MRKHVFHLTRQGVYLTYTINFISEKLNSKSIFIRINREYLNNVTLDPEFITGKADVVPLVLNFNQFFYKIITVLLHTRSQRNNHASVINRVAEGVNARNAGNNDNVPALGKCRGCRVTKLVYLVIYRRVLFNIGIRRRDIRLGLIIVVIRNKILNCILREKLLEF